MADDNSVDVSIKLTADTKGGKDSEKALSSLESKAKSSTKRKSAGSVALLYPHTNGGALRPEPADMRNYTTNDLRQATAK